MSINHRCEIESVEISCQATISRLTCIVLTLISLVYKAVTELCVSNVLYSIALSVSQQYTRACTKLYLLQGAKIRIFDSMKKKKLYCKALRHFRK